MMKKILSALVLISFLAVLAVPMVASAIAEPVSCCKLGKTLEWTSGRVNGTECTPSIPCVLDRGNDVGGTDATCLDDSPPEYETDQWGIICLLNAIYVVTDWIFVFLIAVISVLVVWGGFTIATAAGAPEKVSSGRSLIVYAMAGLVVALLAKAIPMIVMAVVGM